MQKVGATVRCGSFLSRMEVWGFDGQLKTLSWKSTLMLIRPAKARWKISLLASRLFDYARRQTERPPHNLDWDAVVSALNIAGMYADSYADLHAFVGRARDRALAAREA